jgi:hypothetical protein
MVHSHVKEWGRMCIYVCVRRSALVEASLLDFLTTHP